MKREMKLIALDLDGTLLTTDKKLTEYSRIVLTKAMEQGCEVVVSSGRPISAIPKELLESATMPSFLIRTARYAIIIFVLMGVYPMIFDKFKKKEK